jgi:hypothetical protein
MNTIKRNWKCHACAQIGQIWVIKLIIKSIYNNAKSFVYSRLDFGLVYIFMAWMNYEGNLDTILQI